MDKMASVKMLQTGSCGLHVLHNAFRAGCMASHFDLEEFLSRLYSLFEDCPARREDFIEVTGQNKFPLKFCAHRYYAQNPCIHVCIGVCVGEREGDGSHTLT